VRGRRGLQAAVVAAAAALGLVVVPASLAGAQASFSAATSNPGDKWAADTLLPPTGIAVSQSCVAAPTITHRTISAGSGTASLSLAPPTGTTTGDVLVAHVAYRDAAEAITPPGGWVQLAQDTSGGVVTSEIWWKLGTSTETTAVFTRPPGAPGPIAGGLIAYVGANQVAPRVASPNATGTGTTATMPAMSTTGTNVEVLDFLTKDQEALPAPSGTTQLGSGAVGTYPTSEGLTAADQTFAGPGALPTRSSTSTSGTSSPWVAQTVLLKRPAGTPTANLTWTASSSSWATGYELTRSVGGTTQATRTVAGVATASTSEGPLVSGTSYSFSLTTAKGSWRSSAATVGLPASCP
jgi:hypothetical protein